MNGSQDDIREHRSNSPSANASVQDRAGLVVAIFALVLAAFACGMAVTQPVLMEAKVQAGIAPARADMQAAQVNARLALDRADKMAAQLEAQGLIKLENH
jgi:hypothetical protein